MRRISEAIEAREAEAFAGWIKGWKERLHDAEGVALVKPDDLAAQAAAQTMCLAIIGKVLVRMLEQD